jgi:hypothetical protein
MHSRPETVSVASVLLALLSLPNVLYPLLALEGELLPLIYLTVVFGVAGLIAAAGLWISDGDTESSFEAAWPRPRPVSAYSTYNTKGTILLRWATPQSRTGLWRGVGSRRYYATVV